MSTFREHPPAVSRRTALGMMATAAAGTLAACNSSSGPANDVQDKINNPPDHITRSGFPLVTQPTTLDFMTGTPPGTADDWNTVASWKKYQSMTDVTVNWGPVPLASIEEKRNLALASGDYPGAMWGCRFSALDVGKYGEMGVFLPWNDLIDAYMPNLKALMDKYPDELTKGMTYPDGNIYGCPDLQDPPFTALKLKNKLWVRSDWLDQLGSEVPTTVDEFATYLRAVRSEALNGTLTVPYADTSGGSGLLRALSGSFGFGNLGATQGYLDLDPAGSLRFFPSSEQYRECVAYLRQLYAEELIAKDVFSIDKSKFSAEASDGVYGSVVAIAPEPAYGGHGKDFVAVPALEGPSGEKSWNYVFARLISPAHFVLTDRTDSPVLTARWLDHFYSDEGSRLFFMGVEGESWQQTSDGGVEFTSTITDRPKGQTLDEALKPYVTYSGGGYPGIVMEDYFHGQEGTEQARQGAAVVEPDALDHAVPNLLFTADEQTRLAPLAADIEKYATESRDRFISGDLDIDAGWDDYVTTLQQMGLDDYMEIQGEAYGRHAG